MAALAGVVLSGCAGPPPTLPTLVASPVPRSPDAAFELDVRMAGTIACAQFPYGCVATLSVLAPDFVVTDAWRPPATDPTWLPEYTGGIYSTDHLRARSERPLPRLSAGRHQLLVSLLGTYDTPSLNPDGTVATDLLARCSTLVDARAGSPSLSAVVTFTPDPTSFRGTCTIGVEQG